MEWCIFITYEVGEWPEEYSCSKTLRYSFFHIAKALFVVEVLKEGGTIENEESHHWT